jgi:glycosyltransferase involved in cell wall biosynthesis
MAIKALKKVLPSFPNAKLLIVGKTQDRDVSKDIELGEKLGLSANISWRLERVSDQELIWYFSAADIVLFPYQWIYQSGAILMAMSLSKPIIATAVGNNTELIKHNETGLLVPLDDVDCLSDAIIELLSDPTKSSQMGKAAHAHVSVELSWKNIAKLTSSFYDQIVQDIRN